MTIFVAMAVLGTSLAVSVNPAEAAVSATPELDGADTSISSAPEVVTVAALPCSPGSFSATGSEPCTPAPPGRFVAEAGAVQAVPCGAGSFSSVAGATSCTAAPAGSFVDFQGAVEATLCSPGSFSAVSGAVECTLAAVGTFVADSGATEATPCPPGTTTLVEGATSCAVSDSTPPEIEAEVTGGTLGSNGWYTAGDITVTWLVSDAESAVTSPPCVGGVVSAETAGTIFECSATSDGGTTTSSVTIKLDGTGPTVAYGQVQNRYGILRQIDITCTAGDALSGLASADCEGLNTQAWALGAGNNTLTASATDNAGNTTVTTATFNVTVNPRQLCTLTRRFVRNSPGYDSLSWFERRVANVSVRVACAQLRSIKRWQSPERIARIVDRYNSTVNFIAHKGWISQFEATTLQDLAASIDPAGPRRGHTPTH